MPLTKTSPRSRRNGPRVSIGSNLLKEVDELRGDFSRPEFLCRAGYYLISNPDLGYPEGTEDLDRTGYRFAIDPDLTDELDLIRGTDSRTNIINRAGWIYAAHLKSLMI